MKAYLKTDPTRIGRIYAVYVTDFGQKRLTVWFTSEQGYETGSVDAAAEEFEVIYDKEEEENEKFR